MTASGRGGGYKSLSALRAVPNSKVLFRIRTSGVTKMPSIRVPTNILEMRGSFAHDPKRRREREGEPTPKGKIGTAPKYFSRLQKTTWRELLKIIPDNVLGDSDRWAVELAVVLMVEFRADAAKFTAAKYGRLANALSVLGMTPADRSKVRILESKAKKADPWDSL